jgi:hypothetical protein
MFEPDTKAAIRDAIRDFGPGVIAVLVRNIDGQNMEHPQFPLDPAREVVARCRRARHGMEIHPAGCRSEAVPSLCFVTILSAY